MTMRRKLQLTGTTMGRSRWMVRWYEKEMDQCVNRLCLGFLWMCLCRVHPKKIDGRQEGHYDDSDVRSCSQCLSSRALLRATSPC